MRKKIFFSVTILLTLIFIFPNSSSASNITVCNSGCQFAAIQAAVDASVTGDTIIVKTGSYTGAIINKQIILEAETYDPSNLLSNPVKINGQILVSGNWAWDQGPTIRGFYISHAYPLVAQGPFIVEYNAVTATGADGISFESGGGGIARANAVVNTSDDCIDVDNQTKNIVIDGNILWNCGQDGIEIRQQNDSIPIRTTLQIKRNAIDVTGEDGIQIMDYNNFSNRHYLLENNLIKRTGMAAIGIMTSDITNENYSAAAMPEPLYIINNTFVDNNAGISGGANVIAVNNIFHGQKLFDLKNVNGLSKIINTLFTLPAKLEGLNNLDNTKTIISDPKLDSNNDLLPGSPAIDAGLTSYQHTYYGPAGNAITDTVISLTAGQYNGIAPDLGWKEYGNSTSTPTPTNGPTRCSNKSKGDADCKPDNTGKAVTVTDFEIWRKEYFAGCAGSNLNATKCQTDDDNDGSLMDANFDLDNTVSIADFEIWRKGYFGLI